LLTGPVESSGDPKTGFSAEGHFILVLEYLDDFLNLFDYLANIRDQVDKTAEAGP